MKKNSILKILSTFIAVFLLISATAIAQEDFKEITLFTNNGDSIPGLISYKNKFRTFKRIAVNGKNTGITKVFTPETIKSFTIQQGKKKLFFKSLIIEADYSSDRPERLSNSPEIKLTKDTVFAQVLLQGTRNLYYYIDYKVFKDHFLIETENDHAVDLIYKSYYTNASRMVIGYHRRYLSQLRSFLSGSPAISRERINETPFMKKEIVKLINDYNIATVTNH